MKIKKFLLLIASISFIVAMQHDQSQHKHHEIQHRFEDIEKWAERFESPERDEWQKPDTIINTLDLVGNEIIVDIGSATGYFPVRFAKKVPDGKVFGIDIEPGMVEYLNDRARKENLKNLSSILGKPDDPMIPEQANIVFICDTYHHITDRADYFSRLKDKLSPKGRLVIVDFKKGDLPVGPPDKMKLSAKDVINELTAVGFNLVQRSEILPYQYFLIFSTE